MRAEDALKYCALILKDRIEWTGDAIAGSDQCDGHEDELAAIDVVDEILVHAAQFGDPRRYSDGRTIVTRAEIQYGMYVNHIWQPDPAREKRRTWAGDLLSDPDESCPGFFAVTTDPATQQIEVRVVRIS